MTRATLERQRAAKPGERQFTVTRAGCPGIQRYAQSWSGDNTTSWDSLRMEPAQLGLQMSLSGMLNTGHDIGGFSGPVPDAELLIRWTQAGVLHPRFIMNSWKPDGVYTSPWLHPEATPAIREAIRLRYRLMPYLYSLMHEAAARQRAGAAPDLPRIRGRCRRCVEDCDELMLGPFLLAAPVVGAGRARRARLYLPARARMLVRLPHRGAARAPAPGATLAAPLDRLPLLVARGRDPADDRCGRGFLAPARRAVALRLRIFPGRRRTARAGSCWSRMTASARMAALTRLTLTLEWTPERVSLRVEAEGDYRAALRGDRVSRPVRPSGGRLTLCSGPGAPKLQRA